MIPLLTPVKSHATVPLKLHFLIVSILVGLSCHHIATTPTNIRYYSFNFCQQCWKRFLVGFWKTWIILILNCGSKGNSFEIILGHSVTLNFQRVCLIWVPNCQDMRVFVEGWDRHRMRVAPSHRWYVFRRLCVAIRLRNELLIILGQLELLIGLC